MLQEKLEEILREDDQRDNHIKKIVHYGIGGSVVVALTVLGLKYDIIRTSHDIQTDLRTTEAVIEQRVEERLRGYEEQLQSMMNKPGFTIDDPCFTPRNRHVYEVRGCSQ